jgi:hypothetical protein
MSRLEDELRNALRREEPPQGFASRVLARAEAGPAPRRWFAWPPLRWASAVTAVAVVAGGLSYERERRTRAEGERAKEQVLLALHITGSKLQFVKEKIHELDSRR